MTTITVIEESRIVVVTKNCDDAEKLKILGFKDRIDLSKIYGVTYLEYRSKTKDLDEIVETFQNICNSIPNIKMIDAKRDRGPLQFLEYLKVRGYGTSFRPSIVDDCD